MSKLHKLAPRTSLPALKSDKTNNCLKKSESTHEKLDKAKKKLSDEAFENWLRVKREERLAKREEERQLKQIKEEEIKIKKEAAELAYALWKHNKNQQLKAKALKEKQLKEKQELETKLKQQISRERVAEWMRASKYKPRPIPNNQGLLSLTCNPPSFYNPRPWVSIIEDQH